jgi:hypothetical protein
VACSVCGADHDACLGRIGNRYVPVGYGWYGAEQGPAIRTRQPTARIYEGTVMGMWTADRRLYLDRDGKVVEADDPSKTSLLVGMGGQLPEDRARTLGLIDADGATVPTKRSSTKAKTAAPENK